LLEFQGVAERPEIFWPALNLFWAPRS